ncbi:MAG: PQQ-binding-like beta-propeller repeat protein [Anaerolineae bacterium]|nr:PQQ-binding-like beta-propeller repeat protein [Anaerolineae bacterium]
MAVWLLTACTGQATTVNWPGLTAVGPIVYVSHGPAVIAYDAVEQQEQWVFKPENRSLLIDAAASVQDGRVIFGDYGAAGGMFSPTIVVTVYGLEENGSSPPATLWTNNIVAADKIVAAPLQVGDTVYVGSADYHLYALDVTTGIEQWSFATDAAIWSTPTYYEGVLYVTSLDKHVYALDANTGHELWQTELGGAISAQPIANPAENLLYVGAYDNALHALNMETGAEEWQVEATNWIWSAPALVEDTLYFADSSAQVFAINAVSGEKIWQVAVNQMNESGGVLSPLEVKGAIQASPVVGDGVVYIASQGNIDTKEGLLVALEAETGAEIWQRTTKSPLFTTPVIVDDMIVVAMNSELAVLSAYDRESGNPKWSYLPILE